MKANQYRQALDRGEGALPFDRVVECNIGNPQALGQSRSVREAGPRCSTTRRSCASTRTFRISLSL